MESLLKGRLSTVDLLTKIACFVKTKNIFSEFRVQGVQGGQPYRSFPFGKVSLEPLMQDTANQWIQLYPILSCSLGKMMLAQSAK